MTRLFKNAAIFALTSALGGMSMAGQADPNHEHWVSSWFASPQPIWGSDFVLPTNIPVTLEDQTVRHVVRLSAGGRRLRVVFSNRYGDQPLQLGNVHVGFSDGGTAVQSGSGHTVTFNGRPSATVASGASVISDPVNVVVPPLAHLVITSHFPQLTPLTTFHWGEQQNTYIANGDRTNASNFKPDTVVKGRLFLSGILVDTASGTHTVVTLGDSITDGNGSTPDTDRRWPDFLARRFARDGIAVANAGISGAQVLNNRMGVNALARFEQDVLGQPGISTVIVLMGINDIGWPSSPFAPTERPMTAEELIAGYQQLIGSAHVHGVRIIGATLLPFEGALQGTPFEGHYSPAKEKLRQTVNRWIREAGAFDAVVDFDTLVRDPAHPSRMLAAYDSGDHLHPGDAGYRAMADAIHLEMLRSNSTTAKRR